MLVSARVPWGAGKSIETEEEVQRDERNFSKAE